MTGRYGVAQANLASLLTTNINNGQPLTIEDPFTNIARPRVVTDCVRQGSKGGNLTFPEVTFHESGGTSDPRFAVDFAVDYPIVDFEVWDNTQSGTLMSDIMGCVMLLLDRRYGCPEMALTSGRAVHATSLVMPISWPSPNYNGYFLLWRLKIVEERF